MWEYLTTWERVINRHFPQHHFLIPFIKHESLLGTRGGTGVSQVKAQKAVALCSVNISVVHLC